MKSETKILICYNAPVSIFSVYNGKPANEYNPDNDLSEKSFLKELSKTESSLSEFFTDVKSLAIDKDVRKTINNINSQNPDVIFNFVESVEGISSYESCIAGLFELLGYFYSGNKPSTLGNCLNKQRSKSILKSRGIVTPNHITLKPKARLSEIDIELNYPVILKLNNEDASIGISEFSVAKNYKELRKQFSFLAKTYNQEIIIEEYIKGRELNVAILGNNVLPVSEINFKGLPPELPKIVTYDGKWIDGSVYYQYTKPVCPAKLSKRIKSKIEKIAIAAYEALQCRDYARVDIRLSNDGIPYVIEVNPNPDISSDSGFARAASASGLTHKELLSTIANFALSRKKFNDSKVRAV